MVSVVSECDQRCLQLWLWIAALGMKKTLCPCTTCSLHQRRWQQHVSVSVCECVSVCVCVRACVCKCWDDRERGEKKYNVLVKWNAFTITCSSVEEMMNRNDPC